MHRMKTPEERGPIGAWAYFARGDAGLSVEEVAGRLHDRGVAISPATLRGIEGGSKKPGRALLRALSEVYGQHPPSANGKAAGDYAELVVATREQTEAIREQTATMAALLAALVRGVGVPPEVLSEVAEAERALAGQRTDVPLPQPHAQPGRGGEA